MGPIIAYQSKKVTFTLYLCVWITQTIIKKHTEYINTYVFKGCLCHTYSFNYNSYIPKETQFIC